VKTVLYLHGFLSSPASEKVRILREALSAKYPSVKLIAPDMNYPPRCIDTLLGEIAARIDLRETAVVGSSLGGFYALRFARRYGTRVTLLNPCLDPWRFIPDFVGTQTVYGTTRKLEVRAEFEQDFQDLNRVCPAEIAPGSRVLTLISTADEVLPFEKTLAATRGSRQVILTGEDHRISGFGRWVDLVMDFSLRECPPA